MNRGAHIANHKWLCLLNMLLREWELACHCVVPSLSDAQGVVGYLAA